MLIASANNSLVGDVQELVAHEVEAKNTCTLRSPLLLSHINDLSAIDVIFRGNTVVTKTIELAMRYYGRQFLEASIGPVLRRIYSSKLSIETDPRFNTKGAKDIEKNNEQLYNWCQEVWNDIYATRGQCPE